MVGTNSAYILGKNLLSTSTSSIPSGIIAMWSGIVSNIPDGWLLCDGNNGTPNLLDRFIVGAGSSYTPGVMGGSATHKLTIDEMPSHRHDVAYISTNAENGSMRGLRIDDWGMIQKHFSPWVGGVSQYGYAIQNAGSSQAHNNMPPYYALCYIMKT